ncbi:MAG: DUF11 domain-containing protein [Candidatus Niyogibacteria bacterium]|nr:DUF11 domain-containing protein [Candidatus Niyogibacteria bacterium]
MNKNIKKIFSAAFFGLAIFGVASSALAATLNSDPADYATLRVLNYTQNPVSTAWGSSASASAGQEVSFAIYYHNTGTDTATNLRVRITPQNTGSGTTQSFTAYVWAGNASQVSGSATVYLSSSQMIDYTSGTVTWRPNQTSSGSSALPSGQTGTAIFTSSGLNLGDIAPGWSTQGSVVLRYRVSNTSTAAPTVSVYASPASVSYGGSTMIYWSSTNATSCTTSPNSWSGTSGSQSTGALYSNQTYSVTCSGAGGSTTNSVTVSVGSNGGSNSGSVSTYSPYSISSTGATLSCYFNSNSTSGTTGWFEWGSSSSLGNTASSQSISSSITLNYSLTGLSANNTYYTRCAIQNSYGTYYGSTLSFTTSADPYGAGQPTAVTYSASQVYSGSAVLNGYVSPNNSGTTRWFEWGTSSSNLNNSTAHVYQGTTAASVSESVNGLTANTIYYYRAVAQNSYGTVYGSVYNFTAGSGTLPTVSTNAATELAYNHATLNGYLNTNGTTDASRWFEWGTSYSLGNATGHINPGSVATSFGEAVIGLSNNTTYYFRAVAENSAGRVYGGIISFRTSDNGTSGYTGPSAVTLTQENVTTAGAKLNGAGLLSTNMQGYGWFEWGNTAALGNTTSLQTLSRVSTAYFAEQISGLTSGATYYYRAVVKDANGIVSRGTVLSFRAGTTVIYDTKTTPSQPKVYKATVTKSETNLTHPNGTNSNLSAAAGDTIRFTIEAYNSGDYKLEDVSVRDRIPDYLEFATAEGQNMNNLQREVTWYIGTMEPGARKTMTLDVLVTANAPLGFSIVNTAGLQSRKVSADSNEVSIHVDPASSFIDANGKSGDNNQSASTFLAFGGLGWLWFNILFTLLVAAFTAYVVNRLMRERRETNNLQ